MTGQKECRRDARIDHRKVGVSMRLWFVFCGCGYYEDRLGKTSAEQLAAAHNDGRAA